MFDWLLTCWFSWKTGLVIGPSLVLCWSAPALGMPAGAAQPSAAPAAAEQVTQKKAAAIQRLPELQACLGGEGAAAISPGAPPGMSGRVCRRFHQLLLLLHMFQSCSLPAPLPACTRLQRRAAW